MKYLYFIFCILYTTASCASNLVVKNISGTSFRNNPNTNKLENLNYQNDFTTSSNNNTENSFYNPKTTTQNILPSTKSTNITSENNNLSDITISAPLSINIGSNNIDGLSYSNTNVTANNPLKNWYFFQCDTDAYTLCKTEYINVIKNCDIANCLKNSENNIISSIISDLSNETTDSVCKFYDSDNQIKAINLIESPVSSRESQIQISKNLSSESCWISIDNVSTCLINNLNNVSKICQSILLNSSCWE